MAIDRPMRDAEAGGTDSGRVFDDDTAGSSRQRWAAKLLDGEREEALARVAELTAELETVATASMTEGRDDEHDPDGATAAFDQSMAAGLLREAEQRLADVDLGLERLARHAYGRCEQCGGMIADERLAARPATVACVRCAVTRPRRSLGRLSAGSDEELTCTD